MTVQTDPLIPAKAGTQLCPAESGMAQGGPKSVQTFPSGKRWFPAFAGMSGLMMIMLLSACAKVGDLKQPKPLFGDAAKAQYEREQAAKVEQPKKTQNFPAVPAPNP